VAVDADELGGALAAVEVGGREQRAAAVRALQPMAGADGDPRGDGAPCGAGCRAR